MKRDEFEAFTADPLAFVRALGHEGLRLDGPPPIGTTGGFKLLGCPATLHFCEQSSFVVEDGPTRLKLAAFAGSKPGYVHTQYLPWAKETICATRLGEDAELFITPTQNTCAVFIGGDPAAPMIVHANIGMVEWDHPTDTEELLTSLREAGVYSSAAVAVAYGWDTSVFGFKSDGRWYFYQQTEREAGGYDITQLWPLPASQSV